MAGLFWLAALTLAAVPCVAPEGHLAHRITGTLEAGDAMRTPFGDMFVFVLTPSEFGWIIAVHEKGRDENLARLTPPWHFVPNPRYLEGWHFRNAWNTGANDGSVNAPQETREFFFSPEVGRSLDYAGANTPASVVTEVRAFGRGRLTLTDYELTPFASGERAAFLSISFDACLLWRAVGSE